MAGFEFGAFFGEDALGDFAHFLTLNQADGLEVLLDHGADFGDELDMVANFVLSKNLSLNLKFASFDGENGFASRDKTWLSLTYAY